MDKKKILAIIVVILLLIIVLVAVPVVRNFVILKNIQKNIEKYESSTNYSVDSVTTIDGEIAFTLKYYRKDNKSVTIIDRGNMVMSMYDNGNRKDTFIDTPTEKIARLDTESTLEMLDKGIQNYLETNSNYETFQLSSKLKIKNEEYNGKKCYRIIEHNETGETEWYIEKDTGLLLKEIMDNQTTESDFQNQTIERDFQFDQVDDEIFVEPDIGQYTLEQNMMN